MSVKMKKKKKTCSICGEEIVGHGNNAQPVNDGTCCDECNMKVVVPKRFEIYFETQKK